MNNLYIVPHDPKTSARTAHHFLMKLSFGSSGHFAHQLEKYGTGKCEAVVRLQAQGLPEARLQMRLPVRAIQRYGVAVGREVRVSLRAGDIVPLRPGPAHGEMSDAAGDPLPDLRRCAPLHNSSTSVESP